MLKKERQKATKSPPSDASQREERRTKVNLKQKIRKKGELNYTLQTANNSITKTYLFKCEFKHCNI